ncbi:FecR family protein [Oricola sp.]|uniref:FecR family protein n=1 Tax=Oricola sp. TaxID=1979950 RepID=UPI0025D8B6E5|nr:FecR family protein [Oricola sp.]MCI5074038.1 FecR family protein [Oricola sp.]
MMTGDENQTENADIQLSDEAIDWLVRLHSGSASDEDHAAFDAWRSLSDAHESAAVEAETIWYGVGMASDEQRASERQVARRRLTRRAALGGGVIAAGGLAAHQAGLIGPGLFADHITGTGERREIALADGSVVRMNAETAMSVDFGSAERRLTLHRGQAIFEVAHDPARPFIVEAKSGRTRAIGTAFDIDIRRDEVVVTVIEGVVDVASPGAPAEVARAQADQRVRYGATGAPSTTQGVNADVETAWRRGKLVFDRRPLSEVVGEVDRQYRGRIVIANRRTAELEVTGVFDLDNPDAVLSAIEMSLPVRIVRLPLVTLLR